MRHLQVEGSSYHEVDGAATTQDMGSRDNGAATIQPFRRTRVVERRCFGVKLHIPGVDTRAVDPGRKSLLAFRQLSTPQQPCHAIRRTMGC